jgi:hypothetical protein
MKLNKETLRRIIKEELEAVMNEGGNDAAVRRGVHGLAGSTLSPGAEEQRNSEFKSTQQTLQNIKGVEDAIAADEKEEKDIIRAANAMFHDGYTLDRALKYVKRDKKKDWEMVVKIEKLVKAMGAPKPSINDKFDAEEDMKKKAKVIKSKIIPWVEKNAKTLWQKTPLRSEQELLNHLSRLANSDDGEIASSESRLIDILGNDLYDSIVNDRGFLAKFGGLFKRGTFSENKRRR